MNRKVEGIGGDRAQMFGQEALRLLMGEAAILRPTGTPKTVQHLQTSNDLLSKEARYAQVAKTARTEVRVGTRSSTAQVETRAALRSVYRQEAKDREARREAGDMGPRAETSFDRARNRRIFVEHYPHFAAIGDTATCAAMLKAEPRGEGWLNDAGLRA